MREPADKLTKAFVIVDTRGRGIEGDPVREVYHVYNQDSLGLIGTIDDEAERLGLESLTPTKGEK